ncbi:MAG: glycosyltransferase family 2 protein [Chlamydiae bacterium]|nr:glycosyltransferase family 2 protein [Chlamydiota bacterium]
MIPALNEEKNLKSTVLTIIGSAKEVSISLDIVIVNDGSTDRTAEIIRELEANFSFIRSIFHEKNRGIGSSFLEVLKIAKYSKITVFPGDNYSTPYLIKNLFRNAHRADLVISYTINTECRSKLRNTLSLLFSIAYILVFNLHVKYINGSCVYSTHLLRQLDIKSVGYNVFGEINVKLLRKGITFFEVDGYMNSDATHSSAIKLKNFIDVIVSFLKLVFEVHVKNRSLYSSRARRVENFCSLPKMGSTSELVAIYEK